MAGLGWPGLAVLCCAVLCWAGLDLIGLDLPPISPQTLVPRKPHPSPNCSNSQEGKPSACLASWGSMCRSDPSGGLWGGAFCSALGIVLSCVSAQCLPVVRGLSRPPGGSVFARLGPVECWWAPGFGAGRGQARVLRAARRSRQARPTQLKERRSSPGQPPPNPPQHAARPTPGSWVTS